MSVSSDLLRWFERYGRDLPWRNTRDPYAIWVSEVMLQQTRVDTVLPYYQRFMQRFPEVQDLAAASLDLVLQIWEGMGYYARARNLHRASQIVVAKHSGKLPGEPKALLKLPGIGKYTAAAIAAFAFGADVLTLEANLRRVLARLFEVHIDPRGPAGERELTRKGDSILPTGRASDFNQALMDLGALICRPRAPQCARCPIGGHCLAFRHGTQGEIPVRSPGREIPLRMAVAAVWTLNEQVLIRRQPEQGLLGGLWGFPGGFLDPEETPEAGLERLLAALLGVKLETASPLAELEHSYTHFKIRLRPYICHVRPKGGSLAENPDFEWVALQELPDYPMGKLDRQLADHILYSP